MGYYLVQPAAAQSLQFQCFFVAPDALAATNASPTSAWTNWTKTATAPTRSTGAGAPKK